MSLPTRDELDEQYKFNLSQIFESPAKWDAARERLLNDIEALEARTEKPLETPADLRSLLENVAKCYRQKQRLELYATLWENINTNSDEADAQMRRYRSVTQKFEPVVAAVHRELRRTDDTALDSLATSLDEQIWYFENLCEQAQHTCESSVEDVIAAFEETRTAPNRIILSAEDDVDSPEVERPDGEQVEITYGRYQRELSHPNRAYRRRVYMAYHAEHDRFEQTMATAYAEKLKAASALANVHEFSSLREMVFHQQCYPESGLKASLPTDVHDVLLDTVRANLEPWHRTHQLRSDRLGVDSLRPWDLYVPIADAPEPDITYEKAQDHIIEALAPLGEDYQDRARRFFAENRVDVFECEGKRNDIPAYCPSSAADGAFILMNYQEDVRTMFYLCHELGHAMHVAHHREEPVGYATCPRSVEEVPSLLHELLLVEHCIEDTEDGELAAHAKNRLIESMGGNFYNAAMSSAFAHRLVKIIDNSEDLTAERIARVYTDLQAEFAPTVKRNENTRKDWLRESLIREPYHSYQYSLGVTGALAVHDRLQEDEMTPNEYREFLQNTGRKKSVASFEHLGLDVTTSIPYERAAAVYNGFLNEI